jgi:hypothetical protein
MPHPDVSGEWSFLQSDEWYVIVNLVDDDGQLSGSATCQGNRGVEIAGGFLGIGDTHPARAHSMQMEGTVDERYLTLTISWNNGARGKYEGAFQPDGTLAGTAVDLEHPALPEADKTTWATDKVFMSTVPLEPIAIVLPVLVPMDDGIDEMLPNVVVPVDDGIDEMLPNVVAPHAADDGIDEMPPGNLIAPH